MAWANPIPIGPGRSIQVAPCIERASAACWKQAQVLNRFAGETIPQDTKPDVRLAWQGADLLVRVRGNQTQESVEIVLSPRENDNLNDAQLFVAPNGISRHRLNESPTPGRIQAVRILLRNRTDGTTRTWAPMGKGDLSRPAMLWFSEQTEPPPPIALSQEDDTWTVTSAKEAQIRLVHRRAILPVGGKGVPSPWTIKPSSGTPFVAPPHTGWYDIEARVGEGEQLRMATASVYWEAPLTEHVIALDIHPAPKQVEHTSGKSFYLQDDVRLCVHDDAFQFAGEWFTTELRRITGVTPTSSCDTQPRIAFTLEPQADLPDEGFDIKSREDGLQLVAKDPQGALYGAMALADLIGFDRTVPPVHIRDWPTVDTRALFHHTVPNAGRMVPHTDTIAFIERVVARGRYNMLILSMAGAIPLPSRPELVRKDAWTSKQLQRVLTVAKQYGIEVIPSLSSPSHSNWLVHGYPALSEEGAGNLLCTQHPGTRTLLEDLYNDLVKAFEKPRFVHIGHDEIRFRTARKHEDQRCPRCEGTPRWRLLEEDLLWNHHVLAKLGARPMLWSDMLVKKWNGGWDGMYRVVNRIPESIRPDFMVMSWGRVGDTVGTLVPMGYPVLRGNTGYGDWKRAGLSPIASGVAGEALALFVSTPWNSMDGSMEGVQMYHHWSNAILAGATAWEPRLEETPIETTLGHLMDHPAYLPGFMAWPSNTNARALTGDNPSAEDSPWRLDDQVSVLGVPYSTLIQFDISEGESESVLVGRTLAGISVLQAVSFPTAVRSRIAHAHRKQPGQAGHPVAQVEVSYKDGQILTVPVRIGLDTNSADVPLRASFLWDTSGGLSVEARSEDTIRPSDQRLYRLDWHNPHPKRVVKSIRFQTIDPDIRWWISGLSTINPSSKKKDPAQ
jgi:hypothetical protein